MFLQTLSSKPLLAPELPLAFFGFLLHFVWEMWVVPFYAAIGQAGHWDVIWLCTQATFGDVIIMLFAFWGAALVAGTRAWVLAPRLLPFSVYLGIGLAVTVVFEHLATAMLDRWAYAETAPVLPGLGTGLAPLLQWLLLPPLALSLARRQLIGAIHMNPSNRE
ncbi:hypothetical protein PC39_13677 [Salinisphaera sp. PC39]|uniref:hypothetical protein n=1 Tax=Salinisphaera sp. PC39 TaxID=1304156 RepID=UPI003340FE42